MSMATAIDDDSSRLDNIFIVDIIDSSRLDNVYISRIKFDGNVAIFDLLRFQNHPARESIIPKRTSIFLSGNLYYR
jgi:hypothetical protein